MLDLQSEAALSGIKKFNMEKSLEVRFFAEI